MPATKSTPAQIEKKIAMYNMVPNLFWSILCLWPVFVFSYNFVHIEWFCFFAVMACASFFIPRRLIDMLQWSASTADYKKIGVSFVNQFVQDGTIMKRIVKKKFPSHSPDLKIQVCLQKMVSRTYLFEKFHWAMFVYFALTAIYAFLTGLVLWGVFLLMLNFLFNVYPNLLQQYVRMKLRRFQGMIARADGQRSIPPAAVYREGINASGS